MSSDHDHHDDDGAHEIDKMPYGRLFNLLVGLSALTLLACIGVIQMFNMQARWITEEYASYEDKERYSSFREYTEQEAAIAGGYGVFEFEVSVPGQEDLVQETRYHVPVSAARKAVLDDPKLLDGTAAYREWENSPVGKQVKDWGGMPKPQPKEPEKRPEVKQPERPKPTPKPEPADGDDKPGDEGDKKAGDEGDKPADEGDKKPADEGDTPADEGDKKEPADGDAKEEPAGDTKGGKPKKGDTKPPKKPKQPKQPKQPKPPKQPAEGQGDAG